jgi:hypothetical protein
VRESFGEYKKTIESNLVNFTYLYDGDVKSSNKESYSEICSHNNTSPSVIINCIIDIYNLSINKMISQSIDYVIPSDLKEVKRNAINHHGSILHYIDVLHKDLNFDSTYIFTSTNGQSMFLPIKSLPDNKPFPDYFYELQKYNNKGYDLYLCPNIEDNVDESFVYVIDKSIQSLVYSIQNMEYSINIVDGLYKHTINYDFYDCDFTCYKLIIRDLSKIRDIKIDKILNEN